MWRYTAIAVSLLAVLVLDVGATPSNIRIGRWVLCDYNTTGGGACVDTDVFEWGCLRPQRFVERGDAICPQVSSYCVYENSAATSASLATGQSRKDCDMVYIQAHGGYIDLSGVHHTGFMLGCSYPTYGAVGTVDYYPYWKKIEFGDNNRWVYTSTCQLFYYGGFTALNDAWGPAFKGVHLILGARSNASHYFSDEATSSQWYTNEGNNFWNYWSVDNRSIWYAYYWSRRNRDYYSTGEQLACVAAKHPNFQPYPVGGPLYHTMTYTQETNTAALHEIQIYCWATYGTPTW